jgi:hypothetical protein
METFVGNTSYPITHENGTTNLNWGYGNDNLAFDLDGNLWVLQDGDNHYIWVVKNGHSQANPNVELFGIVPAGAEPTGITFSPDNRFLFMSIQHPSGSNRVTTQTDAAGIEIGFEKSTTIVIALKENLGASTAQVWYLDADNDGYAVSPTVTNISSPGPGYTTTVLPLTDCDDTDAQVFEVSTWYLDIDGDGYAVLPTIESCNSPGIGYTNTVLPTTDCDDTDANLFETTTWYLDADGDGLAVLPKIESCNSPGTGYTNTTLPTMDCKDSDAEINPETLWFLDANNDGVEDIKEFIISCEQPEIGYTSKVLRPFSNEIIIKAYPNPTSNTIEIDLGGLFSKVKLTMVNAAGQLIKKESYTNTRIVTLNINALASAIYFLAIQSENKVLGYQKISKQ